MFHEVTFYLKSLEKSLFSLNCFSLTGYLIYRNIILWKWWLLIRSLVHRHNYFISYSIYDRYISYSCIWFHFFIFFYWFFSPNHNFYIQMWYINGKGYMWCAATSIREGIPPRSNDVFFASYCSIFGSLIPSIIWI